MEIAKKFNGEIVSADSRQVYKGMDIATGKDLQAYRKVPVHMLDVVDPTQQFSVAKYSELARRALNDVWSRGKLPILVGGTGLYIKALVDGIGTLNVPPDMVLREKYADKTVDELFNILKDISPEKADSMNESDKKNSRRLIRTIEVASHIPLPHQHSHFSPSTSVLMIGLTASTDILKQKISERIDKWVKGGAQKETKRLIASGVSWDSQSMNAIGYREWKPYFSGDVGLDEVIAKWKHNEWQYAKRQMTWFKRDKRIQWFDIADVKFEEKVERLVREWYTRTNENC